MSLNAYFQQAALPHKLVMYHSLQAYSADKSPNIIIDQSFGVQWILGYPNLSYPNLGYPNNEFGKSNCEICP